MSRRVLGATMMLAGGVVVLAGVIGWVTGRDQAEDPPTTVGAVAEETSTTTTSQMTTTTERITTTTTVATTTTTAPSTTTTEPAADLIEAFIVEFFQWIAAGDVDTLEARLHPLVMEDQDEDLCRAFLEREILALVDYRLAGDVTGPVPTTYGSVTVGLYRAPVAFSFQGEAFTGEATYALVDGQIRWFTECR